MEPICGSKIETKVINQVKRASRGNSRNTAASFFKRELLDYPNAETSKASKKYVRAMRPLKDVITPTNPFQTNFLDLLRRIFVYDPKRRITAKEALEHPWFQENIRDDGTEALKLRLAREDEQVKAEQYEEDDDDYA
ncbi:uncharacterized protein KY384_006697 [Bacidia gigantensis]|uniref:uncharacterized protein n=1 Tax=Bacidia gigantensis TaxID=2732470 RepID=UPI001D05A4CE|nr:uncharacterized protein KY384_006697 [Bacidia gigantensis]KAG8529008.1 hypothetical protein KY384_006697 [Bacidia gigantensis]